MQYNIGDTIEYASMGGEQRRVVVDGRVDDVKHGEPGFSGLCADGTSVWGYDFQITRVIPATRTL